MSWKLMKSDPKDKGAYGLRLKDKNGKRITLWNEPLKFSDEKVALVREVIKPYGDKLKLVRIVKHKEKVEPEVKKVKEETPPEKPEQPAEKPEVPQEKPEVTTEEPKDEDEKKSEN